MFCLRVCMQNFSNRLLFFCKMQNQISSDIAILSNKIERLNELLDTAPGQDLTQLEEARVKTLAIFAIESLALLILKIHGAPRNKMKGELEMLRKKFRKINNIKVH